MSDPLSPYREAVRRHGASFEALLWNSKEYQRTRFRVLMEAAALGIRERGEQAPSDPWSALRGVTIGDVGCGRADLRDWIEEHRVEVAGYVGTDGIPELIAASRERAEREDWANASFVEGDFARDDAAFESIVHDLGARVLVFSGSLNTFDQSEAIEVVRRAFRVLESAPGRGGIVLNFLSARWEGWKALVGDPAKRFDPGEFADAALGLTPRVLFRHDYLGGHDATVGLFKGE